MVESRRKGSDGITYRIDDVNQREFEGNFSSHTNAAPRAISDRAGSAYIASLLLIVK